MMVSGVHKNMVLILMWMTVFLRLVRRYPNPFHAARVLRLLFLRLREMRGGPAIQKYTKVSGQYFSHMYFPGWPSASFNRLVEVELDRIAQGTGTHPVVRLQNIILAITRSCPLRCEHCYEWASLNEMDTIGTDDLIRTVEIFQELGVSQIQLSGGEPLRRMEAILEILEHARPGTDFWILTSGVGLTQQRAQQLKKAGLTGVSLSLDHWDAQAHNVFRGLDASFLWVQRAAGAAKQSDLVLSLSLCPTREFVGRDNLRRYADLATELRADFIQILEPRAVGHFSGQDVTLRPEEQGILERFFYDMNFDSRNSQRPGVIYPELDQRLRGCFGAGLRYLYVDADLQMHACPFCQNTVGNALAEDLEERILALQRQGCAAFADPSLATQTASA